MSLANGSSTTVHVRSFIQLRQIAVLLVFQGAVNLFLWIDFAFAQYGATDGQWHSYAADKGSTKYSLLDQIHAGNIDQVRIAWEWKSVEDSIVAANPDKRFRYATMECTPLMVDETLYAVTPLNVAVALDAANGELVWKFDPKCYERTRRGGPNKGFIHRGAAYWTDGTEERILYATVDARLYALDAKLSLAAGANRKALDKALKGYVAATAELMGRYSRTR